MPIESTPQPEIIDIDEQLRLRRFDGECGFALEWYLDPETVWLVDGVRTPYTPEKLRGMYGYLDRHGELYFIEVMKDGAFIPVGDVTFWQEDMPIVIGDPACRGKQIGRKVVSALTQRARQLGWKEIFVDQIYHYNVPSRKCFEAAGFQLFASTEKGVTLRKDLTI
jgi:RimJ/RimL family protein N-acetyltransferase